jgi:K+-transporting ATPase ATPase C chain
MFKEILRQSKISVIFLVLVTIITGIGYPMLITAIAQVCFPRQANGSLLVKNGTVIGSELIGQYFRDDVKYFWGRCSATVPHPYNAAQSGGSNFSTLNPQFLRIIAERAQTLRDLDPQGRTLVPVDLVTTSASGLDPEITPIAAFYQVPRVAAARSISQAEVMAVINKLIKPRTMHILGEPRVNVLQLNLALDELATKLYLDVKNTKTNMGQPQLDGKELSWQSNDQLRN